MMVTRLQAHGGQRVDSLLEHQSLCEIRPLRSARTAKIANYGQTAAPIRGFADGFGNSLLLEVPQQFRREASLHRREDVPVLRANADERSMGARDSHDTIEELFDGRLQFTGRINLVGLDFECRECERVFLHLTTLELEHHHDHGYAEQQVWHRTEEVSEGGKERGQRIVEGTDESE